MKTRIIILISLVFFVTANVFATQPKKEVAKKLQQELTQPNWASSLQLEGSIDIAFFKNDQGKLEVHSANCKNQEMKALIVKKLEAMDPDVLKLAYDELYQVHLEFKLK